MARFVWLFWLLFISFITVFLVWPDANWWFVFCFASSFDRPLPASSGIHVLLVVEVPVLVFVKVCFHIEDKIGDTQFEK